MKQILLSVSYSFNSIDLKSYSLSFSVLVFTYLNIQDRISPLLSTLFQINTMSLQFFIYLLIGIVFQLHPLHGSFLTDDSGSDRSVVSTMMNENEISRCPYNMTWSEIMALLQQKPCVIIETHEHSIGKRDIITNDHIDMKALQATINDHRTIINYLVNNTVNTTVLQSAILDHHTNTFPILTSWRDWIDLLLIVPLVLYVLYKLLGRFGFTPCQSLLLLVSKQVVHQMHKQQQQQSTLPSQPQLQPQPVPSLPVTTVHTITEGYHHKRSHYPPGPHPLSDDVIRFNNGYASD